MTALALLLLPAIVIAVAVPGPNKIYDASKFTALVRKTEHGVLYRIDAPDAAPLDVLHIFGTSFERGRAQGQLLNTRLLDFVGPHLDAFYSQQIFSLLGGCLEPGQKCSLPRWLAEAIRVLKPTIRRDAPKVFDLALGWLEELQRPHNNASAAKIYDEMAGIARGACEAASAAGRACDEDALRVKLNRVNVLGDLIKMQCTVLGAWGTATPDGKLVQLRALDFGDGPFANATLLKVHHPEAAERSAVGVGGALAVATAAPRPFAELSFPGFVGVVTGLSPTIGLSEKVNDIHGGGTPPGTYKGQATSYVMRDMLQFGADSATAIAIAQRAQRTWGIWLGVGDAASNRLDVLGYSQAAANVYDDKTLPTLTGGPTFDDVAYVDKHAQPSSATDLPDAIRARLGRLSGEVVASNLPRLHTTGDVHVMVADFAQRHLLVAKGTTSANSTYLGQGARKAYAAPFLRFATDALWAEPRPR